MAKSGKGTTGGPHFGAAKGDGPKMNKPPTAKHPAKSMPSKPMAGVKKS